MERDEEYRLEWPSEPEWSHAARTPRWMHWYSLALRRRFVFARSLAEINDGEPPAFMRPRRCDPLGDLHNLNQDQLKAVRHVMRSVKDIGLAHDLVVQLAALAWLQRHIERLGTHQGRSSFAQCSLDDMADMLASVTVLNALAREAP